MSRHAIIDVGSNTIHLLVGRVEDDGVLPAVATLAAILDCFGKPELTVARGGIREGTLLTLAEEEGA